MQHNEEKAINDYWNSQPELHEIAFQRQLQEAIGREKNNPHEKVIPMWELAKYRLNKKIPDNLTFKDRKKLLINSVEWNGWIHKNNKHLTEEEITEENIQQEVDTVGTCWGIEIMKKYQKLEWLPVALNSEICRIYIP